jgi:hypothetical protein
MSCYEYSVSTMVFKAVRHPKALGPLYRQSARLRA